MLRIEPRRQKYDQRLMDSPRDQMAPIVVSGDEGTQNSPSCRSTGGQ